MPSRTEIVISFGEIIECLPPGKQRRKRYNSFDANVGNEENLDPSSVIESCDIMKPEQTKKVSKSRSKCDDTDDEISFRDVKVNGDELEESKTKIKRKSNTEKFLEDNANYFQLEVLNSKTRSSKSNGKGHDSDEEEEDESKDGFHTSFLDFLKSKGVSKESVRSRHKSADNDEDRERSRNGRSRSSFKRYGRSRSSGRSINGRSHSRERRRKKSLTEVDGSEVFISESDSECSIKLPRLDLIKSRLRSASPSECSDSSVKSSSRNTRSKREASPAGSDVDVSTKIKNSSKQRSKTRVSRSSARESTPDLSRPRRSSRRDISPAVSESESVASNASKSIANNKDDSDEDDEDDRDKTPSKRRGRRGELDKLLEAVDTSFHFETAAAERKRLNESGLGPLEIDCSDTGSETSCKVAIKRKLDTSFEKSPGRKKIRGSNNLLKTASPGTALKSEDDEQDNEDEDDSCVWDGWDKLNDDIDNINEDPVEINKMHFSFETLPIKESWFLTYQRQDRGDELLFYPSSTSHPFHLPYQMSYSAFLLNKPVKKEDASSEPSKASSPVRQLTESSRKGEKRKVSDCESTDSSEEPRRRPGRPSKLDKIRQALENNYRVSPRCHASTKSLGINNQNDIDDLEEAYLYQDEKDMGLSALPPYLRDENSNDSFSSSSLGAGSSSKSSVINVDIKNLDNILQDPEDLAAPPADDQVAAKLPPTRSRISSEQLLSPKKAKKKKKVSVDGPGYEPLDQLVADNIDPVLLDCLEDELPTVPGPLLELTLSNPMDILASYSSCRSMSVANSRWLRPNNKDSVGSAKKDVKTKRVVDPLKPKKFFIYKDDLPGFNFDDDMEEEKLPVSKRGKAKTDSSSQPGSSKKSKGKASKSKDDSPIKSQTPAKETVQSDDEDVESVESFSSSSSTSKKKRKINKTGFPTPKKKKKLNEKESLPVKKRKPSEVKLSKSPDKSVKSAEKKSPKKVGVKKQKKMDDFLKKGEKKGEKSPVASSKRSSSAKNYREPESDSESILESPLLKQPKKLKSSSSVRPSKE